GCLRGGPRGVLRPRRRLLSGGRAVSRRDVLRRLRLRRALGLRLLGQLTATAELDPQRVRERRVEWAHGAQPLVTHLLGGDHQLLAGHPELFRQIHQLYLCRHSRLTSFKAFLPLASDCGAPAPPNPKARTAVASSSLASQGFPTPWVRGPRWSRGPRP